MTLGIPINNTISNKISNLLLEKLANGGDGTTDGYTPWNGATLEPSTDHPMFGANCIAVTTPGYFVDEGFKSDDFEVLPNEQYAIGLAVYGNSGYTVEAYFEEKDENGNLIDSVKSEYEVLNDGIVWIQLSHSVATGTKLNFSIGTGYSAQSGTFYYGGGMLVTGLVPPEYDNWIAGQSTVEDDSVSVVDVTGPPNNYIRGSFVEDYVINDHLDWYEYIKEAGCNTLFYLDHQMNADFSQCKTNITNNLNAIDGYMDFHLVVLPFSDGEGNWFDPTDQTYISTFLTKIEEIINTYPQIKGISLNDYLYPDVYWDTSTTEVRTQNRLDLVNFANLVKDLVHSHGLIFSINIYPGPSHDAYIEDLAPCCDMIMPEIYRGMGVGSCPIGVSLQAQHRWFKSTLEYNLANAGVNNVLPSLISYDWYRSNGYPDEPYYTAEDIVQDINIVMDHTNCLGYIICEFGWAPEDMYLPDGQGYTNNNVTRVTTQGLNSGEGIKLTPSLIASELMIKIPKDKIVGINLNLDEYITVTGTGDYQPLDIECVPTDQIISIVTDEGLTIYLDNRKPENAQIDYGTEIRQRLPEHSPINIDEDNLGRILIESVGKYFGDMEIDLFKNSRARFLPYATGKYLDRYGDWFGVSRNGMDDNTYRANIISIISSDITIAGLKSAVSAILNTPIETIDVSNTYPNIAKAGSICKANHYTGVASRFGGHYAMTKKAITITVPVGLDLTLLESVIHNLVIPGVTVTITDGLTAE